MKRLACAILAISPSLASAEIVYSYSFESLPPGWAADEPEWTFGPQGAYVHVGASSSGQPVSNMADMESDSAPIVMPTETDSVLVSLTCEYELDGWYSTGEAYATIYTKAYLDGVPYTVFSASDSWGFPAMDLIDNLATYSITLPASTGQELTFLFRAYASAFGGGASIDWTTSLLEVTVYGPMSLQSQTWAGIKSCF